MKANQVDQGKRPPAQVCIFKLGRTTMSEMQTENGIAGDSMDSSQDVSVKMLLMGLPAAPVIGGITSSFLLSHFVYPALMLYLAITFVKIG